MTDAAGIDTLWSVFIDGLFHNDKKVASSEKYT